MRAIGSTRLARQRAITAAWLGAALAFSAPASAQSVTFVESGGQVVLEAERSSANISRSGWTWVAQNNIGGVGGGVVQALPNTNTIIDSGYTGSSAELQFRVQFSAPGTYRVWIRGYAANSGDNSLHVGLDGQAVASSDRMTLPTYYDWTWTNSTMDGVGATLAVASAGVHTISLWIREDGLYVDRLLLTTNGNFVPSGPGPAESQVVGADGGGGGGGTGGGGGSQPPGPGTGGGVEIYPGVDIQSIVNINPAGTQFVLKAGTHRLQTIRPRSGDTFAAEPGAILSGARALTSFSRSGNYWVATGQTQQGPQLGMCRAPYTRCSFPEDLFIDNQVLRHVGSLGEVGPGRWHFEYGSDQIFIGDDPSGRVVETSVTPHAFTAHGSVTTNVTIAGLVIEKYATPANTGAISAPNGHAWVVSGNEIRFNHAGGVSVGDGSRIENNNVHHNGQVGIGSFNSGGVLIQGNEVAHNGEFFFEYWGAGGVKMVRMRDSTLRGNFAHHNYSGGLWCDGDCNNMTFENNRVEDNAQFGIHYEISFNAVIRNNTVRRNGLGAREGPGQSGIYVFAAKNVEIYGNVLEWNGWGIVAWQEWRGSSPLYGQAYEVENLYVHDNSINMSGGINGLAQTVGDTSYYTSRNNRFVRNSYYLSGGADFYWMDQHLTEFQWQGYGQDAGGSFAR